MGTYSILKKEKKMYLFSRGENVLALSVTWLKNKKKKKRKGRGKKKLLCAVNIEQQPSPDDPCCIQFLPKCFLLNLHQTDTRRTKENLITKGN